jgi:hypothetical protein
MEKYTNLTLIQLKSIAKEKNLKNYSKLNKSDLIKVIKKNMKGGFNSVEYCDQCEEDTKWKEETGYNCCKCRTIKSCNLCGNWEEVSSWTDDSRCCLQASYTAIGRTPSGSATTKTIYKCKVCGRKNTSN